MALPGARGHSKALVGSRAKVSGVVPVKHPNTAPRAGTPLPMALLTLVLLTLALLTLGPASYGSTSSGLGRPTAPYVLRHFLLRLPSLWCSFLWLHDLLTMASAYSSLLRHFLLLLYRSCHSKREVPLYCGTAYCGSTYYGLRLQLSTAALLTTTVTQLPQ